MPPPDTFNATECSRQKERARQDDLTQIAQIAQGADTLVQVRDRNGLVSGLDPARVRLLGRRRIRLEDRSDNQPLAF